MNTIDAINDWTRVMKEYYINLILTDIQILNNTFKGGYVSYTREKLLTLEIAELKTLSFDVSKRLRAAAFDRLFDLRGTLFAEQKAAKLLEQQNRQVLRGSKK